MTEQTSPLRMRSLKGFETTNWLWLWLKLPMMNEVMVNLRAMDERLACRVSGVRKNH
jgi:hypothetical protein